MTSGGEQQMLAFGRALEQSQTVSSTRLPRIAPLLRTPNLTRLGA